MKSLCALCVLCVLAFPASALDREAFTFTKYDLDVRVEPLQRRLGVRGNIILRNDSPIPQKNLWLQISSTLSWRSVQIEGKPVEFETHPYTSDVDHTGALTEAIVTLPHEVLPKASIELEIGYEGIVPLDTTRLTRISVPEGKAKHVDWDQISKSFTAVRGIGYVAWYPIATESANLSDADSVSAAVGRWTMRQSQSEFRIKVSYSPPEAEDTFNLYCSGSEGLQTGPQTSTPGECSWAPMELNVPTFVVANYQTLAAKGHVTIHYLSDQKEAAEDYAEVASQPDLIPPLGKGSTNLQILALPDDHDSPFVTKGIMLTPLKTPITNESELDIVYALARQMVDSPRPWIEEGLSHYAQAAFIEAQKGRQAALDYLEAHKSLLMEEEKDAEKKPHPLISATDDLFLQSKSMYVWWMLRDMTGNAFLEALQSYQKSEDKDADYMRKLLEKKSNRGLQWFFDDWVYHDRGLPDFRVASVFSTSIQAGGYLVTVEIENLGSAGAEVPITLQTETAEIRKRIEVHARSKASIRIEAQSSPKAVTVNDGSVPESDVTNNTFKIESMSH